MKAGRFTICQITNHLTLNVWIFINLQDLTLHLSFPNWPCFPLMTNKKGIRLSAVTTFEVSEKYMYVELRILLGDVKN